MKKTLTERAVIICTEHRGVFFGYTTDTDEHLAVQKWTHLRAARMAIYWGTTRGVMQLAETGPTSSSKLSAQADITVNAITSAFVVSPTALTKWEDVK